MNVEPAENPATAGGGNTTHDELIDDTLKLNQTTDIDRTFNMTPVDDLTLSEHK